MLASAAADNGGTCIEDAGKNQEEGSDCGCKANRAHGEEEEAEVENEDEVEEEPTAVDSDDRPEKYFSEVIT